MNTNPFSLRTAKLSLMLAVIFSLTLSLNPEVSIKVHAASPAEQGNFAAFRPSLSASGRFVAFDSSSTNLVSGDTNNRWDVFVYDREMAVTERVSFTLSGGQAGGSSWNASISGDGRYVAYQQIGFFGGVFVYQILLYDRVNQTTDILSMSSNGAIGNSHSTNPKISADGNYVAFISEATNLVDNDTNGVVDVFVHSRVTGTTERVSIASNGGEGNGQSGYTGLPISVSSDGRFVAFESRATNLVANDSNGVEDIFVRDRQAGTTERISVSSNGSPADRGSFSASISDDGRYVAFQSLATNLVQGDTNNTWDIFVRDRILGITNRVSVRSDGTENPLFSGDPEISGNGRYVTFISPGQLTDDDNNYYCNASGLPGGDLNCNDVFVHDRQTGVTTLVSVASDGTLANGPSENLSISDDGSIVAFMSRAYSLIENDSNFNCDIAGNPGGTYNCPDIFIRDRVSGLLTLGSISSGDQPPPPPPGGDIDFTINKTFIRPIQVVEGANINNDDRIDLVLGKPTVVRVRPIINNDAVGDAGTQLLVSLNFQGFSQTMSTTVGEVKSNSSFYLNFIFTPTQEGDGSIVVTVDPTNLINEASEVNNQDSINVSVKETRSLSFAYSPVNFPNMPDHFNETVQNGEEFLIATYPLAPNKVTRNIVAPINLPPAAQIPNETGFRLAYMNIYLNGKILDPFANRIVAVVPDSFFPYYGMPNSGGTSLGSNISAVLVRDGYYTSQAHEIGHTYGLWTVSGHEEYNDFPPGRQASGYWVERNLSIENSICFMGNSPERFQFNRWIDTIDYVSLFKTLRTNQTDPRVLFVTGFITESGTVEFYKLYKSQQGIVDDTAGEYTLLLLDINGVPIDQKEFGASFDVLDGDFRLEKAPFAFAAALPDNATSLQVIVGGVVKAETNIQSRLLHDAIDAIPASGFINNPEQKRNALHQKVSEVEAKIEAGDIQGAITKLEKDLKPNLQRWLRNNYATDNELQYTKIELISLINEIIAMYSSLR